MDAVEKLNRQELIAEMEIAATASCSGGFAASMTQSKKSNKEERCGCVTSLDKNSANVAHAHASNY
jgi:hypothetical protein